jgi:hypothetical protein
MVKIDPTPQVNTAYGAPMGRRTGPEYLDLGAGRVLLRRIRLDAGGYDPGGAYWGIGQPLYWACDGDGNELFFRTASRDQAKAHLRDTFGPLRFYR